MNEFEKKVMAEARRLCMAYCRAKFCTDAHRCTSGAEGPYWICVKEAKARVIAQMMDTA